MDFRANYNERREMDLQYYNPNGSHEIQNIHTANPNGANSMTRNAMDFNNRQMAKVAETCINNRDCMRVLYHNMYNTDKRGELKQALYGEVSDKLVADSIQPRDIFTHSIVSQSNTNTPLTTPPDIMTESVSSISNINTIKPNTEYYASHNTKKNTYTTLR